MRVLVAGATGAVGRALIPALARRNHVVAGLARNPEGILSLGAEPIRADGLDRDGMIRSIRGFRPDVVVHQLTSLPSTTSLWRFDRDFEQTNRLRTTGTEILLEAARVAGAHRLVAQSFCGWPYARAGRPVKTEQDALDSDPPAQLRTTLEALRALETIVVAAGDLGGTVLRYGSFYGPHTHLAHGSAMAEQVRKRRFPIIGDGGGVWSFVHIQDVAEATVVAVENEASGIYNVVDDEPAPVSAWLPALALAMGARRPQHLPMWLAKLLLPEHLRIMMTEVRGGSNALFRSTFSWAPKVSSWRSGFVAEFQR
jgi:2-alkyl-3-oxoalkanoate reductase